MSVIQDGDTFLYEPWGGDCTAKWVDVNVPGLAEGSPPQTTRELWLARDLHNTDGSQVLKTMSGEGSRLVSLDTRVEVVWDNGGIKIAEMPSPDIIVVWHDSTPYQFIRSSPSRPIELIRIDQPEVVLAFPNQSNVDAGTAQLAYWMSQKLLNILNDIAAVFTLLPHNKEGKFNPTILNALFFWFSSVLVWKPTPKNHFPRRKKNWYSFQGWY